MSWVSQRVEGIKVPKRRERAQRELWQGQCNCPYWHGIFGGLYLHHLRRSTYEHLNRAEALCHPTAQGSLPKLTEKDLNQDGRVEVIIESPPFSFYFLPHRGGTVVELDFHPTAMNILDTLTRREETYHQELAQRKEGKGEGRSIHELEKTVPAETLERAAFDAWDRFSLLDLFLPSTTSFNEFWKGRFQSLSKDPTQVPYSTHWLKQGKEGRLTLTGEIPIGAANGLVRVEKRIEVHPSKDKFGISLKVTNGGREALDCLWGMEWSFNFYDKERSEEGVSRVEVQDGWSPVYIEVAADEPFDYWQFPIETVAQTESDFRLIHQGISVFPHWPLTLRPGQTVERKLIFRISKRQK
jgi:alpha-amylase